MLYGKILNTPFGLIQNLFSQIIRQSIVLSLNGNFYNFKNVYNAALIILTILWGGSKTIPVNSWRIFFTVIESLSADLTVHWKKFIGGFHYNTHYCWRLSYKKYDTFHFMFFKFNFFFTDFISEKIT